MTVPGAIPFALFIAGGPLLSIPLAVVTASPAVGRALVRVGLGRLPEETAPPAELRALALPAIEMSAPPSACPLSDMREAWRTVRGVVRSLRIYYGNGERRDAMDRLYGRFVRARRSRVRYRRPCR